MKIIEGGFGKSDADLAPGFAAILRELADTVDAGEISSMAVICVRDGQYELYMPSSINETILLATLLHRRAVDRVLR